MTTRTILTSLAVTAALACALVYVIARQLGSRRGPASVAARGLATGASFGFSRIVAIRLAMPAR